MPTETTHMDYANCSSATPRGSAFAEGFRLTDYTWIDKEADELRAYADPRWDSPYVFDKSSSMPVSIQVEFTYE